MFRPMSMGVITGTGGRLRPVEGQLLRPNSMANLLREKFEAAQRAKQERGLCEITDSDEEEEGQGCNGTEGGAAGKVTDSNFLGALLGQGRGQGGDEYYSHGVDVDAFVEDDDEDDDEGDDDDDYDDDELIMM
jgi:hypothetical protein